MSLLTNGNHRIYPLQESQCFKLLGETKYALI